MLNWIFLIHFYDFSSVIWLKPWRCIYNKPYFFFNLDKQKVAIRLFLNKFYRMTHQFRQGIVVSKLPLVISHAAYKRRVLFNVPCDINSTLHISVIVLVTNIFLKKPFPHCRFQIARKKK